MKRLVYGTVAAICVLFVTFVLISILGYEFRIEVSNPKSIDPRVNLMRGVVLINREFVFGEEGPEIHYAFDYRFNTVYVNKAREELSEYLEREVSYEDYVEYFTLHVSTLLSMEANKLMSDKLGTRVSYGEIREDEERKFIFYFGDILMAQARAASHAGYRQLAAELYRQQNVKDGNPHWLAVAAQLYVWNAKSADKPHHYAEALRLFETAFAEEEDLKRHYTVPYGASLIAAGRKDEALELISAHEPSALSDGRLERISP